MAQLIASRGGQQDQEEVNSKAATTQRFTAHPESDYSTIASAGGATATGAIGGHGVERMAEALRLAEWTHEAIDGDLYVHGWR